MLQRFLHVLAGAECPAGAGEDRDFELVVVTKLGPGLGEFGAHFMAERIEPLGPVHPYDENLSVTLCFDDGHLCPLGALGRNPITLRPWVKP